MSKERKGRPDPKEVGAKEAETFAEKITEMVTNAPIKKPLINFIDNKTTPFGELGAYNKPDGSCLNVSKSTVRGDDAAGYAYAATRKYPLDAVGEFFLQRKETLEAHIPPLESSDEPLRHMTHYDDISVFDKQGKIVGDQILSDILEGKNPLGGTQKLIEQVDAESDNTIAMTDAYERFMGILEEFTNKPNK